MSFRYKLKENVQVSSKGLTLPGIGIIKAGTIIESSKVIENPNLELVKEEGSAHLQGVVPQSEQSAPQTIESENQ